MKKLGIILAAAVFILGSIAACSADVYVNGYHRSDGTYVQPHYRSNPDGNKWNNYSTKGNLNPYTGEKGYKDPYNYSDSYGARRGHRSNNSYGLDSGW